jgi:hypothetical protein
VVAQARGGEGSVKSTSLSGPALARGDRRAVGAEVKAHAVAVGVDGVAARGLQPRRGRVVALRDAADREHVGRAVGARVGAIGPELDPPGGVVDAQRVAHAEAREMLLRARVPARRLAQRRRFHFELEYDDLVSRQRDAQARAAAAVEAQRELGAVGERLGEARGRDTLGDLELLGRDHALRELDELVADLALGAPDPEPPDQPPVAPHIDPERAPGDLDAQRGPRQHECVRDRRGVGRHAS